MNIQPYTYYKSSDNRRAFLVLGVEDPEQYSFVQPGEGRVVLLEWGKSREEQVGHSLEDFEQLVSSGKLVMFTPTMPANG